MNMNKYVFIGGLHRSGTTLLAKCLAQHPDVSAFSNTGVHEDEGQFLQDVYPNDNINGGPGRFAFDPRAHLIENSPLLTRSNKNKLQEQWARHWDRSKHVLVEKTPGNLLQSRFLQEIFPDSYFVFVVRHPVATSVATHKWSGTGIYALIHHWVYAHDILSADLAYLRSQIVVRYEDFIRRPAETLSLIENFIGIDNHRYALEIDSKANDRYFKIWKDLFLQTNDRGKAIPPLGAVHSHKTSDRRNIKRLTKSYIRKKLFGEERQLSHTVYESQDAVAVFESEVRRSGYSLVDLAFVGTKNYK